MKLLQIILLVILLVILVVLCYLDNHRLNKEFYNISEVEPKLSILEDNYDIIKQEISELKQNWINWPETELYENYDWKIIPLYAFDTWVSKHKKYFKNTLNIVEKIPNVKTILFSKLDGNTKIKPHQGWSKLSNNILRCHLPLIVGKDNYLGVENKKEYHKEGKLIIFDDSKLHYSVNNSDITRIVLIIDIKRPYWIKKGKSTVPDTPELHKIMEKYLK